MSNFISKTREGAKNNFREADYHEFDIGTKAPLIGGKRTIGGANVDQTRNGVTYPNVQSAIDDLYTLVEQIQVNGVYTTTADEPPIAIQQVSSITFSGTMSSADPSQTKAVIHVFGFPFVFDVSNTVNASQVCETVYNKFTDFVAKEQYFDSVARKGVNGDILEVRFIDAVPHPAKTYTENGITLTETIDVKARSGYGSWTKLGSAPLSGVTPAVTVYYFKRIA